MLLGVQMVTVLALLGAEPTPAPVVTDAPTASLRPPRRWARDLGFALGGGAVLTVGVGVVFEVLANGQLAAARQAPVASEVAAHDSAAKTDALVANIVFGLAAATFVSALVHWLWSLGG